MALIAKERNPNDHLSASVHPSCNFYGEFDDGDSPEKKRNFTGSSSNSSSVSSPGSATNSGGFLYPITKGNHQKPPLQPEEGHSVISFNPGYYDSSVSCFLSFEESEEQPYNSNTTSPDHMMNLGSGSFDSLRLLENMSSINQNGSIKDNQYHEELESFAWPNPSSCSSDNYLAQQESSFHKRPHSGEISEQPLKKQCTSSTTSTKKTKQIKSTQPKDPQSIAAKNRRERISERLKVLQDLVPNGSKVDLVTMLEKAISYVKFLQLQVKVLAADEFWPVQGGKPPELSQVKDAIDAILSSSQRDRTSSSK